MERDALKWRPTAPLRLYTLSILMPGAAYALQHPGSRFSSLFIVALEKKACCDLGTNSQETIIQ